MRQAYEKKINMWIPKRTSHKSNKSIHELTHLLIKKTLHLFKGNLRLKRGFGY